MLKMSKDEKLVPLSLNFEIVNNFDNIITKKLDAYISKFYKNELIKGLIYFTAISISLFLIVIVLENLGRFNSTVRLGLFVFYFATSLLLLLRFVLWPFFQLKKIAKRIDYTNAAKLIGGHFGEVEDKLLNLLQLQENNSKQENDLLLAAIEQKTQNLKTVPFVNAINFKKNLVYVKYAIVPLLIVVLVLAKWPNFITGSTQRIIHFNQQFIPAAPFKFELKTKSLNAFQHDDVNIMLEIIGNEVPSEVYIKIGEYQYLMEKHDNVNYSYQINNIQHNLDFQFFAGGFYSKLFDIAVIKKPIINKFSISLTYPNYLKKSAETIENSGDLSIPIGTKVNWEFYTENAKSITLSFKPAILKSDSIFNLKRSGVDKFSFSTFINKNCTYIPMLNGMEPIANKLVTYQINVIPDSYPTIAVDEKKDSSSNKLYFFTGQVKDDYGFSKLTFNYRNLSKDTSDLVATAKESNYQSLKVNPISINLAQVVNTFYYEWNLTDLKINQGDEIEYYFEVSDNDGVNGPKTVRSERKLFKAPSRQELSDSKEANNKEVKKEIESAIVKAKKIQKDINLLNKKMLDKKELGWEEKKQANELLKQQKELQQQVEKIAQKNEQNNKQQNEFSEPSEELLEKQRQMEDLFEKILPQEMKDMYRELEKMLEKMDKDKTQEAVDKMKMDNKELEKELDRNLELFKQLEFDQKLTETKEKLKDLAQKQEELGKENEVEKPKAEDKQAEKKQDDLNKMFEQVKDDLKDLQKKNSELEKPGDLKNTEEKQKEIKEDQKKASDEIKEGKKKNAAKSQKKAAKKMEELAQELEKMEEEMAEKEDGEDYDAMRQLLENILQLSFNEEELVVKTKNTDINNPQFIKIGQLQRKLKDDARMIEDSLFAISKRQPKIAGTVEKEIQLINDNIEKSIAFLQERQSAQAANREQLALTSINNLALIMSESLQNMQQEMKSNSKSKSGKGSCKKPGKGDKPSAGNMRKMQQNLADQLKKLKDGQKPGNQPGKQQYGKNGDPMSKEFSKMAAQQGAIRNALQQALQQGGAGNDGGPKGGGEKGNAKELREILKKMEQNESDIVQKNITNETMKRQQEILSRLLEAEKAERERDEDEKRKSNEAKSEKYSNPEQFLEYKRLKERETELLRTIPPDLKIFYKNKVNDYFNVINQ